MSRPSTGGRAHWLRLAALCLGACLALWLPQAARAQTCSAYKGQVSLNEVRIGASGSSSAKNQVEIFNAGGVPQSTWSTWQLVVYYKTPTKSATKKGGYSLASGFTAAGQFVYNSSKAIYLRNRDTFYSDIALVDAGGAFIDYLAIEGKIQSIPACLGTTVTVNATSSTSTSGDIARIPDGGTLPSTVTNTIGHTIGVSNTCTSGGSDLTITNTANTGTPIVNVSTVTYTVLATNKSCSNTISGIVVTDTGISTSNFSALAASASQGSTAQGASALSWILGSLAPGAAATLTVSGKALNVGVLTTTAAVTLPSSGLVNTGDDSDPETITVTDYNYVGFDLATDTVTEGTDTSYSATISSSVAPAAKITVSYTVTGTANSADTNLPASGTVVIDPTDANSPDGTSIDFTIKNDSINEPTKTIKLTITGVSSTDPLAKVDSAANVMNITLLDDDDLPDHYELSLPTTGISCLPTALTVTACANASSPCTSTFAAAAGKTAALSTSGATLGATTLTFDATGAATTTLSYPSAANGTVASVNLSGEQMAAKNARQCCPNGSSCAAANSCSTTFNSAGFIIAGAANGSAATLPAQTAGTASGTYYLRAVQTSTSSKVCEAALSGSTTLNWAYQCNNPTSCSATNLMSINGGTTTTVQRNNNAGVSSYTSVPMTFDANGNAPFTFTFSDVGQATLWATKTLNSAPLSGASNAFVTRPAGFVVAGIAQTASPSLANPAAASAAGPKFIKAGESFSATVTATTAAGAATPNYGKEISPEGVVLTRALVLPGGGATGTLSNASVAGASFSNGAATVTNLAWDEVGIITLTASVADADYLGAGDVTGTTTGNVGRFVPDHFSITQGAPAPGCSAAFTYFGQDGFTTPFVLTAQSAANATTRNYSGSFALLGLTNWSNFAFASAGLPAGSALTAGAAAPSGSWSSGVASVSARHQVSRSTALTGETSIVVKAAPVDSDGVTMTAAQVGPGTPLRFGRLRLSNAFGSEKAALPMTVQAQYWSGNAWVPNSADSCSFIPAAAVVRSGTLDNKGAASAAWSTTATSISVIGGNGTLTLSAPSPAATGSVDLALNLGGTSTDQSCLAVHPASTGAALPWLRAQQGSCSAAWDRDPAARASFGIYAPETRKTLHVREIF